MQIALLMPKEVPRAAPVTAIVLAIHHQAAASACSCNKAAAVCCVRGPGE